MLWNWKSSFRPRKPAKTICFVCVGQTDSSVHAAKPKEIGRQRENGYYLDEFTFRFNRRDSKSRGKLFYRLLQQAVQVDPVTYGQIIGGKVDEDAAF